MSDRAPRAAWCRWSLRREITTRVRERSFLISTVITLLIVAAVVIVPSLFSSDDNNVTVGLVGDAATVQPALQQAAQVQGATLTVKRVSRRGRRPGGGERRRRWTPSSSAPTGCWSHHELTGKTQQVVQTAYRQAEGAARLAAAGIDAGAVAGHWTCRRSR